MGRILCIATLAFTVLSIATVGCRADTDGREESEIRPAPIHEIQVNIAESFPEQIFVYIKGGLVDSCTTFRELTTERSGNGINIAATTERPKDAICIQVYGYFEKNVALGSDFARGENYTVNVNDAAISFNYPN
jgi:hypothetical protein